MRLTRDVVVVAFAARLLLWWHRRRRRCPGSEARGMLLLLLQLRLADARMRRHGGRPWAQRAAVRRTRYAALLSLLC